ncbi:MAG TPA: hypothetical protein VF194_10155 [Ferrovibrio sp.]|uniref:hypothetical protein n=1 Tax=Ferrovibrio sp. TaxID=1917215 RepID=UPI002ED22769
MQRHGYLLGLAAILAIGIAADKSMGAGLPGQSDPPPGAAGQAGDWPCEQPLRAEISVGSMWAGPDPNAFENSWHEIPAVAKVVEQVAPRRVPQDQALDEIHRFAIGYRDDERSKIMTQVFSGLFDTMSAERRSIIRGIKNFNHRQEALAKRIQDGWDRLGDLDANSTDPAVAAQRADLQQQLDWDARIFDDRQRLLPAICEQPRLIEQRLFALSRAIQQEMAGDNGRK